ncbi:MAG: serine--tRNA ligase [Planctomycetota bacterium]
MIDLKQLRENPDRYRIGAERKNVAVDIDRLLELDSERRALMSETESLRAEQKRLAKESGPQLGKLSGALKKATESERPAIEAEIEALKQGPAKLKAQVQSGEERLGDVEPQLRALLLEVPMPPDDDVPVGAGSDDNIERSRWCPSNFNFKRSFESQRGFAPKSHVEIAESLGLVDFERGVKLAGSRSYALTGDGMRLHQAVLRYAFDTMVETHGFEPVSVPVVVREEAMVGTGFFPGGREQTYHIEETRRGTGQDLFLTGTGEVGLMGFHASEILDASSLPRKYVTVSTCFRREAGAAGRDTAGLYRVHKFDKVEQVVICRADEGESRAWHAKMIGYVEGLLRALELPYRLLQCCTGDLGVKNADMIDIECWMPSRGELDAGGAPVGAFGETHSASRLYDFQCRRLNMRYRGDDGETVFCHSLNNTVAASPRLLIPLLEMHQQQDGRVAIPEPLRAYMGGRTHIG